MYKYNTSTQTHLSTHLYNKHTYTIIYNKHPYTNTFKYTCARTHTHPHASKLARPGPREKKTDRKIKKAKKYRIYYKRGKESKPLQSSMHTFSRLTKMVAYACLHAKIIFCQRHGKQLKANPRARSHFHELQGFAMSFCSGARSCNRSIDPGVFLIEKKMQWICL